MAINVSSRLELRDIIQKKGKKILLLIALPKSPFQNSGYGGATHQYLRRICSITIFQRSLWNKFIIHVLWKQNVAENKLPLFCREIQSINNEISNWYASFKCISKAINFPYFAKKFNPSRMSFARSKTDMHYPKACQGIFVNYKDTDTTFIDEINIHL